MSLYQVRIPYSSVPKALVDTLSKHPLLAGVLGVMHLPDETAYLLDLPRSPLASLQTISALRDARIHVVPDRLLVNAAAQTPLQVERAGAPSMAPPEARDATGIGVAIIDPDGVLDHPAFRGRVRWFEAKNGGVEETKPSAGDHGHGTHMAGVVAGDGCKSLARNATLYSIRAHNAWQLERALRWAASQDPPIHVACIASAAVDSDRHDPIDEVDLLHKAISDVLAQNLVCCVFAGNLGAATGKARLVRSPGRAPDVVTVGGHAGNELDRDTSHGAEDMTPPIPDLLLPWGPYTTAGKDGSGYERVSGTSMAAAFMAGAVATWYKANPALLATGIHEILATHGVCRPVFQRTGAPQPPHRQGLGRLDLNRAFEVAQGWRPRHVAAPTMERAPRRPLSTP